MGKKVIIALTGYFPTDQRMQRISSALHEFGYTPELYYRHYFKYKKLEPRKTDWGFAQHAIHCIFNKGILFYLEFNLRLVFKILFKETEILYATDSDTLLAMVLLSKIKRKPLVHDAHEYFVEVPELYGQKFKKKIWDRITQIGVNQAVLNISVGETLCVELEKRYKKPFTCIRNVPKSGSVTEFEEPKRPILLYQGALNKGRCLEILIDSAALLPEYDIIIIGEGDLSESLRKRAEPYHNIEFMGLQTPENIRKITGKCYLGFNLLDAGESLSYFYSLSNKYFDYMQAGVPSVSSELPEYISLNEKYKIGVCIPNTLESWLNLVNATKTSSEGYRKMKENAIIASQTLNWENEKLQLKSVFKF